MFTITYKNGKDYIRKTRPTKPMKDVTTSVKDKEENIQGAFEILNPDVFKGCTVIILDDIYQTGITIHELASEFQNFDIRVQGLVATKTARDLP